jgi:hypothetical protein
MFYLCRIAAVDREVIFANGFSRRKLFSQVVFFAEVNRQATARPFRGRSTQFGLLRWLIHRQPGVRSSAKARGGNVGARALKVADRGALPALSRSL